MLTISPSAFALLVSSFMLSLGLGKLMMRLNIVDRPDGIRKFQTRPVPALGGVAIALTWLCLSPVSVWLQPIAVDLSTGLALGFTLLCFSLGLWDDLASPDTRLKLALMMTGCFLVTLLGLSTETFQTPFGATDNQIFLLAGSSLWLLIFTNGANFMDGANGLAAGCLLIMLSGLVLIWHDSLHTPIAVYWWPLFGAIAGFLVHNINGKLYAGDAGALGLGALFASLALASGLNIWTLATLALPFLIDVLMTLIWRARHGRDWLAPHLDHAYQSLRKAGWSHTETAFLYWGFSLCCLSAAFIAHRASQPLPFLVFCLLCLAGLFLWGLHRRTKPDH